MNENNDSKSVFGEDSPLGKTFTDTFGHVLGIRTRDGGTEIFHLGEDDEFSQDDRGGALVNESAGSLSADGNPKNPDLSIGLSAASTPDVDNPNHEWRDGKKYAKGTSIEIVEKNAPVKPTNFIDSAWGTKA